MFPIAIEIRNYRCFSDEEPLRFTVDEGFAAFVGANNSGKSSCLKFFHEMRNVWSELRGRLSQRVAQKLPFETPYLDVTDPLEVFFQYNERPIAIDLSFTHAKKTVGASQRELVRVVGTCMRSQPMYWTFVGYDDQGAKVDEYDGLSIEQEQITAAGGIKISVQRMNAMLDVLIGAFYVPPFRNATNMAGGAEYQFSIASEFVRTWDTWKNGGVVRSARLIGKVTSDIRSLFGFEDLEINADAEKKRLNVVVDGQPYKLYEQGSGLQQFIVVLGNIAVKNPTLVLIDEPDLHLHPSLQLKFLVAMGSYAKHGVIFATHSIGLARSSASKVFGFTKVKNHSQVRRFSDPKSYSELLGELNFAAHRDMGYEALLLVEGANDVTALVELLRKLNKDHKVVTMPLGGREMITPSREAEISEIRRLSDRMYLLLDSEKSAANEPVQAEIEGFAGICEKNGIVVHVTKRRAIENYFTQRAVTAAFGAGTAALGEYENPKGAAKFWGKNKNWRVASEMSRDEILNTDVGEFLSKI